MDITLLDNKSLANFASNMRKNSPDSPWITLSEAQIYIRAKIYHKAKKKLEIVFKTPGIEEDLLFSSLKLISLVKDEKGLKLILTGVREELYKIISLNLNMYWHVHILTKIGFVKFAEVANVEALATHLVSYFANQAYDQDKVDLAFFFEQEIYQNYITRNETEKAFGHGMSLTKEASLAAGRRALEQLGPIDTSCINQKPIVGFFFHNASMLAHIEQIYGYLSTAGANGFNDFTPILFCLGGRHSKFEESFTNIGVKIVYLDVDGTKRPIRSLENRFQYMRNKCQELQVDKMVWGCLALNMPFVYSMRLANEQIWWSQKWQNLSFREIDKYIYSERMQDRQQMHGQEWLCAWFQKKKWLADIPVFDIMAIRAEFHGKVILGSIARVEKISDPRYLKTLCKILKQNDNVIYLWAGREPEPLVADYFKSEGVYNKTKFVGWVNTDTYARVLDIMLDTFPAGNGVTAIKTMAAGKPIVMLKSSEAIKTWDILIGTSGVGISDRNEFVERTKQIFSVGPEQTDELYTCAKTIEQYIALANKLIADPVLRSQVGDAFKKYVDELMCSPDIAERKFTKHILSN